MLINITFTYMKELFNFGPEFLVLVPLVLGVVEIIKRLGMKAKWAPVASIVLSVGGLLLVGIGWQGAILSGIFVGLSASGLWSGAKSVSGY